MRFGSHMKHMLVGGGIILAVLLTARVPLGTAVQFAVLLACPLMMAGMMLMMARGGHRHGRAGGSEPVSVPPDREGSGDRAP